jgi:phosphatidylglycerol:prolipoprotein diacylglycerol transferase
MSMFVIPYPLIDPVALELGPISVRWYGLSYMAGLLLGWLYTRSLVSNAALWRNQQPPFKAELTDDLLIWVTLGVVIGGRLGFVFFYEPSFFIHNPLEVFAIWHGGMAFHGGLLGAALAIYLFARRNSAPILSVMDICAAAMPLGLFFGRIANFINAEIVGKVSDVPWAMVFPGAGPDPRHPTQIYEALLEGVVLFLILRYLTHKAHALRSPGLVTGALLLVYGVFRIFVENFKQPDFTQFFTFGPITAGMVYSLPMVLLGIYLMQRARRAAVETA